MDLARLYGGSFVDWERVASSWAKRTVSSRLLLFAARRYLDEAPSATPDPERMGAVEQGGLPDEVLRAFASPPEPTGSAARRWGEFVDAAVAAELEVVSYGERPPPLHELRAGLEQAAREAGGETELGRGVLARGGGL